MKTILTLALMVSAVALSACGTGNGKSYPAPYAHERTAGGPGAEATFEKKMAK